MLVARSTSCRKILVQRLRESQYRKYANRIGEAGTSQFYVKEGRPGDNTTADRLVRYCTRYGTLREVGFYQPHVQHTNLNRTVLPCLQHIRFCICHLPVSLSLVRVPRYTQHNIKRLDKRNRKLLWCCMLCHMCTV